MSRNRRILWRVEKLIFLAFLVYLVVVIGAAVIR